MKDIIIKVQKNAELTTNKIRIPQVAINKMGRKFNLIVYKDKIILEPLEKKGR